MPLSFILCYHFSVFKNKIIHVFLYKKWKKYIESLLVVGHNIRVATFYYTVHRIEDRQAVVHDSRLLPENRATLDYCPAEWVTGLRLRSDNDRCGRHAQRSHRSLHGSPTPVSDCCIYSFNEKEKEKTKKTKICLDAVEYIVYSSQFWDSSV